MNDCLIIKYPCGAILLKDVPVVPYDIFYDNVINMMKGDEYHCLNYFAYPYMNGLQFICIIANDAEHSLAILGHFVAGTENKLRSLSSECYAMHGFEREIHENYGIAFDGHPWLKPMRFPVDARGVFTHLKDYPFYSIDSEELHEVGVGPVHAGIIEPGHFRFLCNGEKVLHLEIQLGYQHRGVEALMGVAKGSLQSTVIAENIAGDTAIGHSLAHTSVLESLGMTEIPDDLQKERVIALELERIAVHVGDTAALCTDIAYQLGQVVNESLRTVVINTTQLWCGNRFGKGLIRPVGTHYPLNSELAGTILFNLDKMWERYSEMTAKMFSMPSVLARFDGIGSVSREQLNDIGAVGMAARMGGLMRDTRISHPGSIMQEWQIRPVTMDSGDVLARASLRQAEVEQSKELISRLISTFEFNGRRSEKPRYSFDLKPSSLAVGLAEGWRGEICHAGITDEKGKMMFYKVKDPSFHNWMALALALRGQEISDFPVCNKSFNLSYCGFDI